MTHRPPAALIKFLNPYNRDIQELALKLRALVLEEMGPCFENIYDAYSAVAIGYGTSDRQRDGIFHIAVYSKHVNLGFNEGATLDDPKGILQGDGKQIRHISLKTPADLERPELRAYIKRARKVAVDDARKLGEKGPAPLQKSGEVISVVKAVYAKKRRPAQYQPRVNGLSPADDWVEIPGACATLGVERGSIAFGWDNEHPALSAEVPAFSIERHDAPSLISPRCANIVPCIIGRRFSKERDERHFGGYSGGEREEHQCGLPGSCPAGRWRRGK